MDEELVEAWEGRDPDEYDVWNAEAFLAPAYAVAARAAMRKAAIEQLFALEFDPACEPGLLN
jgi:hypothetical protein